MESADTSSAGIRSASACATAVLPEAVGPKIARTSVTQPRAGAVELVLGQARVAQVGLHAAVTALELLEDAPDRLGRRLHHAFQALELLLGLRLGEPLLVPWTQPLLAERVVRGDLVDVDSGHVQEEG